MSTNQGLVNKVGTTFFFNIKDQSYVVDLKNRAGKVSEGYPSDEPDVTVQTDSENFIKVMTRETLLMEALNNGVINMKGDLSKALNLNTVITAARLTSRVKSVRDVFSSINNISSPTVVKEIGAVFHFKISDQCYVVDLKNGTAQLPSLPQSIVLCPVCQDL